MVSDYPTKSADIKTNKLRGSLALDKTQNLLINNDIIIFVKLRSSQTENCFELRFGESGLLFLAKRSSPWCSVLIVAGASSFLDTSTAPSKPSRPGPSRQLQRWPENRGGRMKRGGNWWKHTEKGGNGTYLILMKPPKVLVSHFYFLISSSVFIIASNLSKVHLLKLNRKIMGWVSTVVCDVGNESRSKWCYRTFLMWHKCAAKNCC